MIAKGGTTGYGIFEVADDTVIEGAVEFTGNTTRDRDAWESTFGVRPVGSTPEEMLFSHLLDGDDTGADRARPLRAINRDDVELWFGGRKERKLANRDKLQQAVYARRDLDKVFDDVEAGKLPPGTHRKMLQAIADKLGIDAETLKSKSVRWRNERAEPPQTLLYDGFFTLDSFTQFAGTWSVSSNRVSAAVDVANNSYLRHIRVLSSADHEAQFADVDVNTVGGSFGNAWRMSTDAIGTEDMYLNLTNQAGGVTSTLAIYSIVNGAATLIGTLNPNVFNSSPQRGDATGSTIRSSISLSTWGISVTNTAITSGVRVGVYQFRGASNQNRTGLGFRAIDGGSRTPTITSVTPSSGPTAGGTAITISGTNFDGDATSQTGGNANTSVVVKTDIEITAVTPAGTAGAKDVTVTNVALGLTGTGAGAYTYVAPLGGPSVKRAGLGIGVGL
jgi:hypothetical protein